MVLVGIFGVILTSYVMAHHFAKVEESRFRAVTELEPTTLDPNVLESTTLEPNVIDTTLMRSRAKLETWSRVATRAYVAMVLCCAGFYMGPQFLGLRMSVWYFLMLYCFPFVSAFFVYRVWRKVREE